MRFADEIAKARASGESPMFPGETFDAEARPLPVSGSTGVGHVKQPKALEAPEPAQRRISGSSAGRCVA